MSSLIYDLFELILEVFLDFLPNVINKNTQFFQTLIEKILEFDLPNRDSSIPF